MSKPFFIYVVLFLLSFNYIDAQEGWMNKCNSSKVVGNYVFTFHAELNIDDKNRYIEKSLNSINECLDLIGEKKFYRFYSCRIFER